MSTELTWQTESTSSEDTLRIGEMVGRNLHGGELIELRGDLGSGKTTFVKGVAKGMGSEDKVHSPSFTLSNEYNAGDLRLYHFDFYRLSEPGIMQLELAEELEDPNGVVVVEWPEIIEGSLPGTRLIIRIKPLAEKTRKMSFLCPKDLRYILSNLTS